MPSKLNRKYPVRRQEIDERDYKVSFERLEELPEKVDLRDKCPPVWDQGSLGSCTAFAGCAARMIIDNVETDLSKLYLYYKERELEGTIAQDSGATMRSICKALNKFGVCTEEIYPYIISNFTNKPPIEADVNAINYKINSYKALDGTNQIKRYLATYQKPVLMGIMVYESFEADSVRKTGIVPIPDTDNEELLGGHAITIVGYLKASEIQDKIYKAEKLKSATELKKTNLIFSFIGWLIDLIIGKKNDPKYDDEIYFICRNSWSSKWGDNGYFYLPEKFVKDNRFAFDAWTIT